MYMQFVSIVKFCCLASSYIMLPTLSSLVCSAVKKQVQPQSGYHQEENRKSYRTRLFSKDTGGQVCLGCVR